MNLESIQEESKDNFTEEDLVSQEKISPKESQIDLPFATIKFRGVIFGHQGLTILEGDILQEHLNLQNHCLKLK